MQVPVASEMDMRLHASPGLHGRGTATETQKAAQHPWRKSERNFACHKEGLFITYSPRCRQAQARRKRR